MVFLTALVAAAAVASPSPSASPTTLPEIVHVTTSDRSDETLRNSVRTTYVVTAADIARNGYRTITDAISKVPGVQTTAYGTLGAQVNYGIRGSDSTQVLVLVNGQPVAGALGDSVQLGTFTTAGVERIEVVEGGGSTLYGSGSIGGIINIITSDRVTPANATLRYGTFDDRELEVNAAGFSFERIVADNAFTLPANGLGPTTRPNSDYASTTGRYGAKRKIGAFTLAFNASAESDDLGAAGTFPDYSTTSREHDVNEQGTLTLALPKAQSTASVSLFGSSQDVTFACDEANDANCFTPDALTSETRNGLSIRDVVNGSNERTIYGIDLSRGVVRSDDGFGDVTYDALAQSAAYAQQTWIGPRNEYYAGIRGERDGSVGGEFSPSVGAKFALSEAFSLKLNAATAFRAPNAVELYFPGYGSVAQGKGLLQPERAQVGDVTLEDSRALGGASLGWFDTYTRDMIVPTCIANCDISSNPSGVFPNYAPQNVDRAHIAGFTFETRTVPLNSVSATLNVTDLYLAQDLTTQERLPGDPVFTVNLGLVFTGRPHALLSEAGISERVAGQRPSVDPTQLPFWQPVEYSDLTAYASFRVASRALLTVRGYNLGNERYAEILGYPMPGRTFAIELRTR